MYILILAATLFRFELRMIGDALHLRSACPAHQEGPQARMRRIYVVANDRECGHVIQSRPAGFCDQTPPLIQTCPSRRDLAESF